MRCHGCGSDSHLVWGCPRRKGKSGKGSAGLATPAGGEEAEAMLGKASGMHVWCGAVLTAHPDHGGEFSRTKWIRAKASAKYSKILLAVLRTA